MIVALALANSINVPVCADSEYNFTYLHIVAFCNMCVLPVQSVKAYVLHCKVHYNEPCCIHL